MLLKWVLKQNICEGPREQDVKDGETTSSTLFCFKFTPEINAHEEVQEEFSHFSGHSLLPGLLVPGERSYNARTNTRKHCEQRGGQFPSISLRILWKRQYGRLSFPPKSTQTHISVYKKIRRHVIKVIVLPGCPLQGRGSFGAALSPKINIPVPIGKGSYKDSWSLGMVTTGISMDGRKRVFERDKRGG